MTTNATPRFLSKENPIPQKDYGSLPAECKTQREKAHEEACRDLDKSPEQILVDIHDESLDDHRPGHQTISRAVARMASLQLRTHKAVERLTYIVIVLAVLSLLFIVLQFWLSCKTPNNSPDVVKPASILLPAQAPK